MKTTLQRVQAVFVACGHPRGSLSATTTPAELKVDSLGIVDLAIELEKEFDVTIDDRETEGLGEMTIDALVHLLDRKLGSKEAA